MWHHKRRHEWILLEATVPWDKDIVKTEQTKVPRYGRTNWKNIPGARVRRICSWGPRHYFQEFFFLAGRFAYMWVDDYDLRPITEMPKDINM